MPDGTLLQWLTSAAPPAYAMLLGSAILAVRFWPVWKQRLTEAKTAEDEIVGNQWKRFQEEIQRLDGRCERLEEREEECQRRLGEALHRIAEIEGYEIGRGKADQEAQAIISKERLRDGK